MQSIRRIVDCLCGATHRDWALGAVSACRLHICLSAPFCMIVVKLEKNFQYLFLKSLVCSVIVFLNKIITCASVGLTFNHIVNIPILISHSKQKLVSSIGPLLDSFQLYFLSK